MCDTVVIKKVRDGNSQYNRKRVLVKEMEQLLQLDEINHKNKIGKWVSKIANVPNYRRQK